MSFLKAEWRKLAIANYEIDPKLLLPYLPFGTKLDLWKGKCYVSLIGFMFKDVKLLGFRIPFHTEFEEVNLRFYVTRLEQKEGLKMLKRGVVFIKEIVPKPAITFVANTVYGENYETMKMSHQWIENENNREIEYTWQKNKNEKINSIYLKTAKNLSEIKEGSKTEFITEHYWGYAKQSETETNEYEVTHPTWRNYDVLDYKINADFGGIYGEEFSFLDHQKPDSVMLAEGSKITVEPKSKIK
ncbi:YqjF family protein [Bernardetia sp. OM2101]|uniref:YqjF family protein n=1 Tax=Bernardetia sp. OM2101 TaxID=3344876 RepID=UPI0035D02300